MQLEELILEPEAIISTADSRYLPRVGKWEYDVANSLYTWSEAIFDILELPYDTKPDNTYALTFYREPYQGMLKRAIANAYQFGTSWDLELELVTARNNTIWVRSHGKAIVENEAALKVEGFLMDIDKYRAREAFFDLLKQKHKQLNTFNHVLTHDLRNHANNIAVLTSMIETDALDEDNAVLVDKIAQVAEILTSTINHLSAIIKVNENQIESEQLGFEDTIMAVSTLLQADLEQNEANIQTDFRFQPLLFLNYTSIVFLLIC